VIGEKFIPGPQRFECIACEKMLDPPAGYYGDTFGRTMNYMAARLSARF
jgi:hypothetical protein